MKRQFIRVLTTDGYALVPLDNIACAVQDPRDKTTMLHLYSGQHLECHDDIQALIKKAEEAA